MKRRIVEGMLGLAAAAWSACWLITLVPGAGQPPATTPAARAPALARAAESCRVEATGLTVRANTVTLGIRNTGDGPATIREIQVYWPVRDGNGALQTALLGDRVIWQGSRFDSPTTITSPPGLAQSIPGGATDNLTLAFADRAQLQHYVIQIAFEQDCPLYFSTRGNGEACQVSAGAVSTEQNQARVMLHNSGALTVEVRAVEVHWPSDRAGSLVAVILGRQPLWQGQINKSPATVIPNPQLVFTPSLPPGDSRLTLAFTGESVPATPYTLDVTLVEGCHAFTSNAETGSPSRVLRFTGVIGGLPADGLLGGWQVDDKSILVDARTVIKPPRVQPRERDLAKVTALSQTDGSLLALNIDITPSGEPRRIELRGTIEDVDADRQLMIVDGRTVVWDDATQLQGELVRGWIAQVSGTLLPEGQIDAESITTLQPDATAARVEFKGRINQWSGVRPSTWVIGSMTVKVTDATVVIGSIEVGALAEVKATILDGRWVLAEEIRVPDPDQPGAIQRVTGVLHSLPAASATGAWSVRDERSPVVWEVEADAHTFIDQSRGRAKLNSRVTAYLTRDSTGQWRAVRIEVLRQGPQNSAVPAVGR